MRLRMICLCAGLSLCALTGLATGVHPRAASVASEASSPSPASVTVLVKWRLPDRCERGCAYYLNICNNGKTNFLQDSPGVCKNVNVANERVYGDAAREGTREVSLNKGEDYRIVLTADNAPAIGRGRFAAVKKMFGLQSDQTVTFGTGDFQLWRARP